MLTEKETDRLRRIVVLELVEAATEMTNDDWDLREVRDSLREAIMLIERLYHGGERPEGAEPLINHL